MSIIRYEARGEQVIALHDDGTETVEATVEHSNTPQSKAQAYNMARVNAELMNKYADQIREEAEQQ